MADMLQITLVRSPIGYPGEQRKVLRALGLGKMNSSVIHTDQPSIRGMIKHVRHLVAVTPWCPPEVGERREGELSE